MDISLLLLDLLVVDAIFCVELVITSIPGDFLSELAFLKDVSNKFWR